MNRNIYLLIFLIVFSGFQVKAQPSFLNIDSNSKVAERGLVLQAGGGVAAVNSDICKTLGCNRIGPNLSLGALYKINPMLAISTELDYLRLGATEAYPGNPSDILSFRSEVIGLSGAIVLNLKDSYKGTGNYRSIRKRFIVPFVTAGAGIVYYTPTIYRGQDNLNGSTVFEDTERKYPAVAFVVPIGGGLRFRFSDKISIAPELIYHISSTDYLDNIGPDSPVVNNPVSPVANDRYTTDHYGIAAIKVLYTPPLNNKIFSKFK